MSQGKALILVNGEPVDLTGTVKFEMEPISSKIEDGQIVVTVKVHMDLNEAVRRILEHCRRR